jgi:hypothetical protein
MVTILTFHIDVEGVIGSRSLTRGIWEEIKEKRRSETGWNGEKDEEQEADWEGNWYQ